MNAIKRVCVGVPTNVFKVRKMKLSHASHKRAKMEPDPWSGESTGSVKHNSWPFAIGMSAFIIVMGVIFPKMLNEEQKIALNNQRATDTYAFLKDDRYNPYVNKE